MSFFRSNANIYAKIIYIYFIWNEFMFLWVYSWNMLKYHCYWVLYLHREVSENKWEQFCCSYRLVRFPPFFLFLINTRCCLWWLLNKERAVFSCNLSAPESGTWHMSDCDKWCRDSVISPGMPLRCPKPQSQMLLLN